MTWLSDTQGDERSSRLLLANGEHLWCAVGEDALSGRRAGRRAPYLPARTSKPNQPEGLTAERIKSREDFCLPWISSLLSLPGHPTTGPAPSPSQPTPVGFEQMRERDVGAFWSRWWAHLTRIGRDPAPAASWGRRRLSSPAPRRRRRWRLRCSRRRRRSLVTRHATPDRPFTPTPAKDGARTAQRRCRRGAVRVGKNRRGLGELAACWVHSRARDR